MYTASRQASHVSALLFPTCGWIRASFPLKRPRDFSRTESQFSTTPPPGDRCFYRPSPSLPYRWIVWKLAAMERRFPEHFPGGYLTAGRLGRQLQYRWAPRFFFGFFFPLVFADDEPMFGRLSEFVFSVVRGFGTVGFLPVTAADTVYVFSSSSWLRLVPPLPTLNVGNCVQLLNASPVTPLRHATQHALAPLDALGTDRPARGGGGSVDSSLVRRYRYGVELDRAKKPCLKAVLQGDASAARPMVLCVSRVYTPEELGGRGGDAAAIVEVCILRFPPPWARE